MRTTLHGRPDEIAFFQSHPQGEGSKCVQPKMPIDLLSGPLRAALVGQRGIEDDTIKTTIRHLRQLVYYVRNRRNVLQVRLQPN